MKQRLLAQAQKVLRQVLKLFSLGAVLFIMEACYGVPYGLPHHSIQILVVDTAGNPLEGIAAFIKDSPYESKPIGTSNDKGLIVIEVNTSNEYFEVILSDIDNELNGSFESKTISINSYGYSKISVALQPTE